LSPEGQIAILGASGLVGSALLGAWSADDALIAPSHADLDVLDADDLTNFVAQSSAQAIVNVIAWADVDGAEPQTGDTHGGVYRLNVEYPRHLAELCERTGKYLLHVSTDYVFDGRKSAAAYVEDDATGALCWYAQTKLLGEHAVREASNTAGIARIEMPFTGRAHRKSDLARTFASRLRQKLPIQGVTDQRITPLFLDDGAAALRILVQARHAGVIHVAAADWTTPYDFARGIADRLHLSQEVLHAETFERFSKARPALRPQHSWLDVSRFTDLYGQGILKPVEDGLDRWMAQCLSK
jgi:dTDP-4-dehydrorhamnose reductase